MADINSHESMTSTVVGNYISGHEFSKGNRLVAYNDTPCQHRVNGGICGWYPRDHASELPPMAIEQIWDPMELKEAQMAYADAAQ